MVIKLLENEYKLYYNSFYIDVKEKEIVRGNFFYCLSFFLVLVNFFNLFLIFGLV